MEKYTEINDKVPVERTLISKVEEQIEAGGIKMEAFEELERKLLEKYPGKKGTLGFEQVTALISQSATKN